MKKIVLFILLFSVSATVSFFYFLKSPIDRRIYSPLPDFLTVFNNKEVSTVDLWLPSLGNIGNFIFSSKEPQISAKSALVYDLTANKVLYQKNPKEKLPMASLTKIMTAIIALENKRTDNKYVVSSKNLVGENTMGLSAGEVLSFDELLHGLILNSGNDAAETLAENTIGRKNFIMAMNKKSVALGLKDTNFTNPTGLEGDGDQHTTAYDLLIITEYALSRFPEFAKTVSDVTYEIPYTPEHKAFEMYNETNLLTSYPGVRGVKDGYTDEAGLCLVTYLDYKGHKIIGVILGSSNRRQEMKELLDYSLTVQGITPPPHS